MQVHFQPLLPLHPLVSHWPKQVQWVGWMSRVGKVKAPSLRPRHRPGCVLYHRAVGTQLEIQFTPRVHFASPIVNEPPF